MGTLVLIILGVMFVGMILNNDETNEELDNYYLCDDYYDGNY